MLKKSYPETGGKNGAKYESIFCARVPGRISRGAFECYGVAYFAMPRAPNPETLSDRSGTVSDPYLSTPDEFEDDKIRVRKLRSSVTTSEHTQDDQQKRQTPIMRFTALRVSHHTNRSSQ